MLKAVQKLGVNKNCGVLTPDPQWLRPSVMAPDERVQTITAPLGTEMGSKISLTRIKRPKVGLNWAPKRKLQNVTQEERFRIAPPPKLMGSELDPFIYFFLLISNNNCKSNIIVGIFWGRFGPPNSCGPWGSCSTFAYGSYTTACASDNSNITWRHYQSTELTWMDCSWSYNNGNKT